MHSNTWRVTARVLWLGKPKVAISCLCLTNPRAALSTVTDLVIMAAEWKNRNFWESSFSCAGREKVLVIGKCGLRFKLGLES